MLPDLPSLKAEIVELLMHYFSQQVHAKLGVFQQARHQTVHEGDRMRIIRADGVVEDSNFHTASSELTVKFEEASLLSVDDRLRMFDNMAQNMANQLVTGFFESLDKTLDAAGQTIDGRGQSINGQIILDIMRKLQIDFLPNGEHVKLSLVVPPHQLEAANKAFEEIDGDPNLKQLHDELLALKKAEWRDREAARKLVG